MNLLWIENVATEYAAVPRIAKNNGLIVQVARDLSTALDVLLHDAAPKVIVLDVYIATGNPERVNECVDEWAENTLSQTKDCAQRHAALELMAKRERGLVIPLMFPELRRRTIVLSVVRYSEDRMPDCLCGVVRCFSKRHFYLEKSDFEAAVVRLKTSV